LEAKEKRKEHDTRDIEGQVDETLQRVAEIKKMFGEFDVESELPKVNLPRLGARVTAENQRAESRGQIQGQGTTIGRHHRRLENRRERRASSHPPNPSTQPFTPPQEQVQIVPASQTTTPYSPAAIYPGYPCPYPLAPFTQPPVTGYIYPEYAPHQQPHYFTPAYPTYATPATYTDTIPYGAYPWAAEPQKTPGMPWMTQGPGPYRTPGFTYPNNTTPQQTYPGSDNPQVPADRQLPAPEQVDPTIDPDNQDKGKQLKLVSNNGNTNQNSLPLPLCGLPIGAGPEGTSHMPSWQDCPLRRSTSASTLMLTPGGEGDGGGEGGTDGDGTAGVSELDGAGVAAAVGQEGTGEHGMEKGMEEGSGARVDVGQVMVEADRGGEDKEKREGGGGEGGKVLSSGSPPPRPHSAAT
jgi:hypothetical protein